MRLRRVHKGYSNMIDSITIQKIKDVARVTDVVGDFVSLRKCGVEWTAPCPFHHGEHLNHFKLNPKKNMYYCFVCGQGGGPVDFLMNYEGLSYVDALRWLGKKYSIYIDEEQKRFVAVKPSKPVKIEKTEELPVLDLPLSFVESRMDTSGDTFCNWVRQLPWDDEQRGRVEKVLKAYAVGHAKNGMTIFWQIDEYARVRTGKMMYYKPDGHRDKERNYNSDWVHATLSRAGRKEYFDPDKQQMQTCLFGLHLLHAEGLDSYTVNLVESEKTAIIMAIALGPKSGLWMATGGMRFLNKRAIESLLKYDCKIVLYPDHDGRDKWLNTMIAFGYQYRKHFQINEQYVGSLWRDTDGEKADSADVMLRIIDEAHRSSTIRQVGEIFKDSPAIMKLIDKLDLEIIELKDGKAEEQRTV